MHQPPLPGRAHGGLAARRAVVRWGWRLFRREWRQQLLVVTLLTVAVAAAVASISIVHNTDPAADPQLGAANTALNFDAADPEKLRAGLAAARHAFGTIDVTSHRSVAVPGSVDSVDYRAQDPRGRYASALLALRRGTYPAQSGEVAVTDGVAELLQLDIGSSLALDGRRRTVVGIVENPRKLSDEFALVAPSSLTAADFVTVLVDSNDESRESFYGPGPDAPPAFAGSEIVGSDNPEAKPLAMFSVATVFLLLASLVAAAGFAVVAQRRLRQLGMLAAVGATEKQLRLVLLANGAVVGAVAALAGTATGLAVWVAFAPTLESTVDHRIGRLSLPWWLIATTIVLAVLGAMAAAWWPGRAASRVPIVLALSGRPPRPRPARHSAIAAAALIAVGVACLVLSDRETKLLIVAGIVVTILGGLLIGPLAIRIFSGLAGHVPIAPRLALRDLVRYQARSGAALAAVTLALGIAATLVIVASAEAAKEAAEPPTLSDRQMRVYLGTGEPRELTPVDALARLPELAASVGQLAGQFDHATVTPLRKARQPGEASGVIGDTRVYFTLELTKPSRRPGGGMSYRTQSQLYVATPAVLRYLGIDPGTVDPGTDFLVDRSIRTKGLVTPIMKRRGAFAIENVQKIETGQHLLGGESGQGPPSFITLNGLRRHGWSQVPASWLVESSRHLTRDQIADARSVASDAGLAVEVDQASSNTKVMQIALAAGTILALSILAMTVGLIRSESAGDLRILTATGATARACRSLTATTAGSLALLGAILGVAGAYVLLAATYHDDLGYLSDVPFLYLGLAVVVLPLVAAAAGWLLAGREPAAVARAVID